ncbi:MAG: signal recognition particle protein [Desulfovibrionaceae bacterium]|nr:signal recognition particle protein [Desulfovibrionaceae bacterium]
MFEALSNRLNSVFRRLGGQMRLTEENIQEGLREVRMALLEADVNLQVVKEFIERVRERALGQEVMKDLTPGQHLIKVVNEELIELLGGEFKGLEFKGPEPHLIMMVGLQGSGKTTSSAKLADFLRRQKMRPYLVPLDVYRPAAIEQLQTLGAQLDVPVYPTRPNDNPVNVVRDAIKDARERQCTALILDTAGRLHIDEALMQELVEIKSKASPEEILFVADAMTGQDAVTAADAFNKALGITGVVLTKMDGDARGGAALSVKSVSGAQVKFVGMGEKIEDLELFYPDRIAGRILGMGDVLTLIEKAQEQMDQDEAEEISRKMLSAEFNLEDFQNQMRKIRNMGPLEGLLKLIPGMSALREKMGNMAPPEKEMNKIEAIINSMTREERRNPKILNGSRRLRIARGSGTQVADVNKLMRQFEQMRELMKKMGKGGLGRAAGGMPSLGGFGGMGGLGSPGGMPGGMGFPGLGGGSAPKVMTRADKNKKKAERKKERQNKKRR